jgi:hypothetical protein
MFENKNLNRIVNIVWTIILITLVVLCFSSCRWEINTKPEPNTVSQPVKINQLGTSTGQDDKYYEVYTLEGCEYIVVSPGNSHFTWGTHKGNCKNPIHDKTR